MLVFIKSKFCLKKILNLFFKHSPHSMIFLLLYVFLQYFSLTSYCVNEVSKSEDLLIRGGVNLYFNQIYMHADAK